jgi:hypothetical protein
MSLSRLSTSNTVGSEFPVVDMEEDILIAEDDERFSFVGVREEEARWL